MKERNSLLPRFFEFLIILLKRDFVFSGWRDVGICCAIIIHATDKMAFVACYSIAAPRVDVTPNVGRHLRGGGHPTCAADDQTCNRALWLRSRVFWPTARHAELLFFFFFLQVADTLMPPPLISFQSICNEPYHQSKKPLVLFV